MSDILFHEFDQFVLLKLRISNTEVKNTELRIIIESTPKHIALLTIH